MTLQPSKACQTPVAVDYCNRLKRSKMYRLVLYTEILRVTLDRETGCYVLKRFQQ